MKLTVGLVNGGESAPLELLSLCEWLTAEARGAHGARITPGGSGPGKMSGTALDVLDIVLSGAFDAASLTVAVMAWRSSRRDAAPVRIEIEGDGTVVTIADGGEETAARVIAALQAAQSPSRSGER
ncbi:hypothetical protein ABZ725_01275 [Streptomyces sp. NPDC006872]|uniref:effector-associated constant component EACC1 n=1 Tax=Streptomyces sp. NPDC006872 TaxID=3155720 RepID=UPI00340DB4C5